jgi:hypothetical protein
LISCNAFHRGFAQKTEANTPRSVQPFKRSTVQGRNTQKKFQSFQAVNESFGGEERRI